MSYFCQFCDKEMNLVESVVYEQHYITCGNDGCKQKARDVAEEIRKEKKIKRFDVILFSSKTPENPASWRVVAIEDYPDFIIHTPEVMERMLEGDIVNTYHCNATKEVYYCAKLTKDVQKDVANKVAS